MTMRKTGIIVLLALCWLWLFCGALQALLFGSTCQVSGTIYLYGNLAVKGTPLEAFIGEQKVAETKVVDDGKFTLTVREYDPANPDQVGYQSPEDIIQVKLSGKDAKPTFSPDKDQIKITLSVEQSLDVKLSTWGKIKALFK